MEIKITNIKIKCDAPGCKNLAKYVLKFKKIIGNGNLYFCESCLTEMHKQISNYIVPKSIKSIYKKISDKKED